MFSTESYTARNTVYPILMQQDHQISAFEHNRAITKALITIDWSKYWSGRDSELVLTKQNYTSDCDPIKCLGLSAFYSYLCIPIILFEAFVCVHLNGAWLIDDFAPDTWRRESSPWFAIGGLESYEKWQNAPKMFVTNHQNAFLDAFVIFFWFFT